MADFAGDPQLKAHIDLKFGEEWRLWMRYTSRAFPDRYWRRRVAGGFGCHSVDGRGNVASTPPDDGLRAGPYPSSSRHFQSFAQLRGQRRLDGD